MLRFFPLLLFLLHFYSCDKKKDQDDQALNEKAIPELQDNKRDSLQRQKAILEEEKRQRAIAEKDSIEKVNKKYLSELVGTYEYSYPVPEGSLNENQYIVIEKNEDDFDCLFYGTSDEFDMSREGYYPGYYVTPIQKLRVNKEEIYFTLNISSKEIFTEPINRQLKSRHEVANMGYENWEVYLKTEPQKYKGIILPDKVILLENVTNGTKKRYTLMTNQKSTETIINQ
ncbi:hypothetical protein [Flammeovirga aprica]|uniref:Uncharacterized protein n=1 Tax=Flammeovirga aprica JL-4 TaxID=694437 RepID=A0A7X9P1Y8_9BACT|nr:hypothetical protein [Flammeovirga aprica]NME68051.1 hypothetical protein [Flammeovirga aprica JL-4]